MSYKITLQLPAEWTSEQDVLKEPDGTVINHLECHLPDDKQENDIAFIDVYVGPMPPETSAQDEALANYANMVGWDDDDDEDPVVEWPFNGKKAYGFEAYCEDESPMRVMCVEVKKGVLCVMSIIAKDDEKLVETIQYVERHLRIAA